jgi:hypothetical protein
MLEKKLAELERENARLAGRASGLRRALAETEERTARATRELGSLRRKVKDASARALAGLAWLAILGGGGFAIHRCGEAAQHGGASRDVQLTVVESDRDDLRVHSRCEASIVEDGEGCLGALRCGGEAIYEGEGDCSFIWDSVEYWDRELDETPRFILLKHEDLAILRGERSTLVLARRSQ